MAQQFWKFILRRFDRKIFSGLPITLFAIAFLVTLFLLLGVIEDFLTSDTIVTVDRFVAHSISPIHHPVLTRIFLWITILGYWKIVITSAIVASLILWIQNGRSTILALWVSITGSELFNFLAKLGFHRERPEGGRVLENTFSFPSGHATIAISFYAFILYIVFNRSKWRGKLAVVCIAIFLGLLIGFSRIYLGAHFISDVLAGYLLGLLWLIIGIAVDTGLHFHHPQVTGKKRIWAQVATALLLLSELSYFISLGIHYDPFHK